MDLFTVQRYEGEDPRPERDGSADKSTHLQRLLEKIEEKKRKAAQLEEKSTEDQIEQEKKKRKKAKKEAGAQLVTDDKHVQRVEHPMKFEKKEKKKRERITDFVTDIEGKFTVLGNDFRGTRKSQVKAALPHWIANPSLVSVDLKNLTITVDDIPQLHTDLVEKLRQNKITHLFPVQHQVIPWLLEVQSKPPQFWPRDVCVSAPTGSGKTLAFVLPIIQALRNRLIPHIRALVVVPVQELANQVYKVFLEYMDVTNLRVVCTSGNESFEEEQLQLVRYSEADSKYYSRADIVVTTPGRLVDHLHSTAGFSLHHLKYLVIDEADRVIEAMQNDWLYHLHKHISPDSDRRVPPLTVRDMSIQRHPVQKLLYSATFNADPEILQKLGLFQPRLFTSVARGKVSGGNNIHEEVGKYATPDELTEHWVACDITVKPLYLYQLIMEGNWNTVLVFVNTLKGVHRLAGLLQLLFKGSKVVSEVSSALGVKKRKEVFEKFSSGKINILVCSDALTRGIDVPNIDCVVSYDAPNHITTYIHRVGRTGRAGRDGTAITLVTNDENHVKGFKKMLTQAGKLDVVKEKIVNESSLQGLEDKYKQALEALRSHLEMEENKKRQKLTEPKKKSFKHLPRGKRKFASLKGRRKD